MDESVRWQGHEIEMVNRPALKYLWLATETRVRVDGQQIGRSGGFVIHERLNGTFLHEGRPVELRLRMDSDLLTILSVPYALEIDGQHVAGGRLKIHDWARVLVPVIVITTILSTLILGGILWISAL